MVVQQPFSSNERSVLISQLGLITRAQAHDAGETEASIKAKLHRGEWILDARGIYRVAVFPRSPEQAILSVCLRAPGRTWASHRTAAWLHGLCDGAPTTVSVTTLAQLKPSAAINIHRTEQMSPADATAVKGVPTTRIERTLIDFAAEASLDELQVAVDEALVTKRTSLAKVEWRLRRTGGRGRAGSAALGRCLEQRQRHGQVDSRLERLFLSFLEEAQLPPPRLQYPISLASGTVRADFAYPEQRLIIEVMGYRWHGGQDRWERDLLRSSELAAAGWRMIYVTRDQMRHARTKTIDRVRRALGYNPLFVR